jgi:hypothetical protein
MLINQCGIVAMTVCAFAAVATGAGMLGRSPATKGEAGRGSPMPDAAVMVPAQAEETRKPRPALVAEVPKAAGDDRRGPIAATERRLSPWGEPVDRAIRKGVRFLIQQQDAQRGATRFFGTGGRRPSGLARIPPSLIMLTRRRKRGRKKGTEIIIASSGGLGPEV